MDKHTAEWGEAEERALAALLTLAKADRRALCRAWERLGTLRKPTEWQLACWRVSALHSASDERFPYDSMT